MGSTCKSGEKEMSIAEIKEKKNGRPTIKEIPLPPHVQRALVLRGNGISSIDGLPLRFEFDSARGIY